MKIKLLKKLREKARKKFAVLQENENLYWITVNDVCIGSLQSKERAIHFVSTLRRDEVELQFYLIKYKNNLFERVY